MKTIQQHKLMPVALWIACLSIAAYLLAQSTAIFMTRSFDGALMRNAETAAQNRSEGLPLVQHPGATGGSKSATAPEANAGSGVKVEQVSDTQWIVDRTSIPENPRDLNHLLMQVRAVPCMKQGRTVGVRIIRISPGSPFDKIGLQNGDVLLRINRRKLDNPAKFLSLYQEMRSKRHISLLLSRNGHDQTFHYDIR